jgi:lactoylglutathione lyase
MSTPLDHVMMRVEDLDAALDWYTRHLEYEEKERHEADDFTIVYLGPEEMADAGAMLELTANHDDRTYDLGDAWGHIAVRVEDVYDAYEELMDGGVEDYRDPDSCGGRYAFVKDPDGHEVEIVGRDHGARWSLDHTMIRVENVDEAIGWWVRKLEYENTGRWESDTFANYFLTPRDAPAAAMDVELTYNYDGRTYDLGDAWGHLAVAVDDLHEGWERLVDRHAEAYRTPADCDDRYAFTRDPDGHEVEVVERGPDDDSLFPF